MNSAEILSRLYREKKEWKASGNSKEILWVLRGIEICFRHVHEAVRQNRNMELRRRPRTPERHARRLFAAIKVALGHLRRGDRSKSIAVLEGAMNRAKMLVLAVFLSMPSYSMCISNQFTMCNTPMDHYVTENLLRLADLAQDAKERDFFKELRCWDEGDETKGMITCEDDGKDIHYAFERHDDYKPNSLLVIVPAPGVPW